jgi:hypothetical protein
VDDHVSDGQPDTYAEQKSPKEPIEPGSGLEDLRFILDRIVLILWLITTVLALTTSVTGFVLATVILTSITVLLTVVDVILRFHWHVYVTAWLVFAVLLAATVKSAQWAVNAIEQASRETLTHGWLTPASEPIPVDRCPEDKERGYHAPPSDATLIFLGSVEVWWPASFQAMTIALVSFEGQPVLTFARLGDQLSIDALVFDAAGKIVAKVENGVFTINPNNYFTVERPDAHTLRVFDQQNRSALFVHFLNPRAIYVTGEFHGPHGEYISITDKQVEQRPPNVIFADSCFGNFEMLPDFRVFGIP